MPFAGYSQTSTANSVQWRDNITQIWTKRRQKEHSSVWPRSPTLWRFGLAAKTYVLNRCNLVFKSCRHQQWDIFWTQKRWSKHCSQTFNLVVLLHLDGRKDLLYHQGCLERISLDVELTLPMLADSEDSTTIQSKAITTAHLNLFGTQQIRFPSKGSWIIELKAKTIAR